MGGLPMASTTGVGTGHEGVQISVHEGLQARRWVSNADLGHPRPLRHVTTHLMINKESLV